MARSVVAAPAWGGVPGDSSRSGDGLTDTELATRALLRRAADARQDLSSFYGLAMRHETTKIRLSPAPHQQLMFDFMVHHPWCVIRMPVGTGKCVTGDTLVVDQRTGRPRPIRELVEDDEASEVLTWGQGGVRWGAISEKHATGRKRCLRIRTRTGRLVETTPEHPYVTIRGWTPAAEIKIGDAVGIASRIPGPHERTRLDDAEVDLFGLLFAEGSLTGDFVGFSTSDLEMLRVASAAADRIGCDVKYCGQYDYRIVKRGGHCSPASTLARIHGLRRLAKHKRVPCAVFALPDEQLRRFLMIVWAGDGTVSDNDASITLASEGGIDDIQHLLLRFGVQTVKRFKTARYQGKMFPSWRLTVRADSFEKFSDVMTGLWGFKRDQLDALLAKRRCPNEGMAIADKAFQKMFLERLREAGVSMVQVKRRLGWNNHLSATEVCFGSSDRGNGRRGVSCGFAAAVDLAGFDDLRWICDGSVYWDEVVSVEELVEQEVYDLTVPGTSCFLANDIIAHNTFGMVSAGLWLLGNDVTQRGAVVSKTQDQAAKPLSMLSDYITEPALNAPVIMTFPWLQRSPRTQDQWTRTRITVDRDPGIRDPSVVAVGYDGAIAGSRLSWLVADDLIDDENSGTPHMRETVQSKFDGRLISRLDPQGSRAIVCNTPWHRKDQTYHLELVAGWPTLTMDIYGYVRISNADSAWLARVLDVHLRPSVTRVRDQHDWYRLRAHDPDPDEETPLWPARYSAERIREIRYGDERRGGMLPHEFARLFMCEPFDETAGRCQRDWIERCKRRGLGVTLVDRYDGPLKTHTGIDIGVGEGKKHDPTVMFTCAMEDDGSRRILDVESGKWSGPTIIAKLLDKVERYRSSVRVESNAAQAFIRQFALEKKRDLQIVAHTTTRVNKADKDFGVESLFTEMENWAWIIPCDPDGKCHKEVQTWINDMLYYQPPPAHTGNHLMAAWLAREQGRLSRRGNPKPKHGKQRQLVNSGGF